MLSSEYVCLVGTCRNRVEDPLVPCGDCVTLLGSYLQPSGRDAGDGELGARRASSAAKAARAAGPAPVRCPGRLPRLTAEELAEEAVHLVWWCGVSREEAATRLGVSKVRLETALRQAQAAA